MVKNIEKKDKHANKSQGGNSVSLIKIGIIVCIVILVIIICVLCFNKGKMKNPVEPVCIDVVQNYLDNADMNGQDGQQVQKGDNVVVDYIGRLADGTVFDTSVESVAKGCGKYSEGRNYNEGLAFTVGAGQMIAGFDNGVEGMKIGQTKTVEIPAVDAYGERDESLVYEVNKSDLQNPGQYVEGEVFYTAYGQQVKVYKVTKDKVFLDTNHELAGKNLIFDITLKEIK